MLSVSRPVPSLPSCQPRLILGCWSGRRGSCRWSHRFSMRRPPRRQDCDKAAVERPATVNGGSVQMENVTPAPAVRELAALVGTWRLVLWGGLFLPDPEEQVDAGPVHSVWIEDGAVLAMRQGGD